MPRAVTEFFGHFRANPLSWLVAALLISLLGLGVYFLYQMNIGMRRHALVHDQQQHLQLTAQLIEQRLQLALAELRVIAERNQAALDEGRHRHVEMQLRAACRAYPDMAGLAVRANEEQLPIQVSCGATAPWRGAEEWQTHRGHGPSGLDRRPELGYQLANQQLVLQWQLLGGQGGVRYSWQLVHPLTPMVNELGPPHGDPAEMLLIRDDQDWREWTSLSNLMSAQSVWGALTQTRLLENETGMFLAREVRFRDPADRSLIDRWWLVAHVSPAVFQGYHASFYRHLAIMAGIFGLMLIALYLYSRRVIGEQVRMVSELQRKQVFLDSLLDSSPDAMVTVSTSGEILSTNACAEAIFGHRPGHLQGRSVELLLPSDYQTRDQDYQAIYDSLSADSLAFTRGEMIGVRAQGETFPVEVTYCRLQLPDQPRLLLIVREETERKVAEQELDNLRIQYFQQEKMAQIGLLMAGILHEVGNPLAAIEGLLIEVVQASDEDGSGSVLPEAARDHLNMVMEQTARIRNICHEVSGFASPRLNELGPQSINQILQGATRLLGYDKRWRQIRLDMSLDSQLPAIKGIADQLTQVFMNLLVNAADAFLDGKQAAPCVSVSSQCLGDDLVLVTISDNGGGISDETMRHIFESFYTTKPKGKGTGLGLSICEKLIEEHGGSIEIESKLEEGTTVRLYFPVFSLTDN